MMREQMQDFAAARNRRGPEAAVCTGEIRFPPSRLAAGPAARGAVMLHTHHADGRRTRAAWAMRLDAKGWQIEDRPL